MADLYCRKDGVDTLFIRGIDLIPTGRVDLAQFGTSQIQRGEDRFLLISSEGWVVDKDDLLFVRDFDKDIWVETLEMETEELKNGTHCIRVIKGNPPE